ncbi:TIM-barrel domain-containing protein [Sphingomonas sp.]|uniref:TIM-barrel domain-containing protein n=1 Tax=Sphingomonas sp. TaxID=28214 RepID=UPI0038A2D9C1
MKLRRLTLALVAVSSAAGSQTYQRTDTGIIVVPARRPDSIVRLQVYGDGIIRVTEAPTKDLDLTHSLMVVAQPSAALSFSEAPGNVTLKTAKAAATVDLRTGRVSFRDADGRVVLAESGAPLFTPTSSEGVPFLAIRQQFNRGTNEGFYGLGQHQFGQMNYNGEDVELAQHNMDVAIPFVVSTRNYGLLWDNDSITRFGDPVPYPLAGASGDGLKVTGKDGAAGWTATYTVNGRVIAERQEPAVDLQYLENRKDWPAGTRAPDNSSTVPGLKVTWTGTIVPAATGLHRFRLYSSSYAKLFVDRRKLLDRWRQNWNPWYHNADVELTGGKRHEVRLEWEPNGGYIALLHRDPRPDADRHTLTLSSDFGHAVDYYFVGGRSIDEVIGGYRQLTGKAPIMPKWAYGFWQSRQRYETQDQLLSLLREYRKRGLPLDNIVQDWDYWPEDQWGCQCFDASRFPDPRAMVDEVHRSGAHVMISVWAKFYPGTANYRELDAVGGIYRNMVTPRRDEPVDDPNYIHGMYRDWIGKGYANAFYDPYNTRAKHIYSRQVIEGIGSKGFDAWWLDSDEPDFHSNLSVAERQRRMSPTALGPGAAFFNAYPLEHVEGVYDHMIAYRPDVRPFILTRSGFGGIQRAGAAIWSGDVASRWDNLREQISAGINFSMSGIPNWSHDIGGYTMEDRFLKPNAADLDEWRELNTRWFQFGAFSPIFRSHGENIHREIFEMSPEGSPTYRSMVWYDKLRYRLMPYTYTLGADTYFKDGTIMRGLVLDFAGDKRSWNIGDEYMFGPAFLVAPVTDYKARSRKVYLPAGASWVDFYTGSKIAGGRMIDAAAPYERMPLFVRAGSIVPTGPAIQFTGNDTHSPLTVNVYTGADGGFSLYEDDDVSRQYLHGQYSRIPFAWNERRKTLTIGPRQGSYRGMAGTRVIKVRWVRPGTPLNLDASDATITYTGAPITVRMR